MDPGGSEAAADILGALARCDRVMFEAQLRLNVRTDVVNADREVNLYPRTDGGVRAELGVSAFVPTPRRAAFWYVVMEGAPGAWAVTAEAFVIDGGGRAPLRPDEHWDGPSIRECAAAVARFAEELVANVASVDIMGPETPRAPR